MDIMKFDIDIITQLMLQNFWESRVFVNEWSVILSHGCSQEALAPGEWNK